VENLHLLYDETESTSTRFVGIAGDAARFDVIITTTAHFYGKKLVAVIQTGRTAIMSEDDALNLPFLMQAFNITDEDEVNEFSQFLSINL
jgi:hypothetical protein